MKIIEKLMRGRQVLRLLTDSHGGVLSLPIVKNIEDFLSSHNSVPIRATDSSSLDLGCGGKPRNPFKAMNVFGVDIRGGIDENIKCADLTVDSIPFADNRFDCITAYDFLEHIPRIIYSPNRRFPFVELMNEIWRVLKPNGLFLSHTPMSPFSECFSDPTHVNALTQETFPLYFDDKRRLAKMYGFNGSFVVVNQVRGGSHLIALLKKAEPSAA